MICTPCTTRVNWETQPLFVVSLYVSCDFMILCLWHFLKFSSFIIYYRKFLRSTMGWTCIFTCSFILLLSLSARHSISLTLRHLSRIGAVGLLWCGCRHLLTLLEDATGTCYEPMPVTQGDAQSSATAGAPMLLLHEDQTRASCLRGNMLWRGYEVSQDILILCLCCLLLLEELSVFGLHVAQRKPREVSPGAPLRLVFLFSVFLLCVLLFLLLCMLAYFPKLPSQQLGGALGYLGWKGLYQGWYKFAPRWCFVCLPKDGLSPCTDTDKH